MKKVLIACILLVSFLSAQAQLYELGQDPASVKWRYIRTGNFKIIYPDNYETGAINLANSLEYAHTCVPLSLGARTQRTNIIIHNRTVVPNAFSLWLPQRAEFFICPSQNSYAQDWMEQLSIHEYRHMVQFYRAGQGISRLLYPFTGQWTTGLIWAFFMPMWYMEGDAVCAETVISETGRGRLPYFEMKTRAQVLEKGIYPFSKAQAGSYRDYVPDGYHFGYNYVAYARKWYGQEIFTHALDNAARKPWMVTPFSRGIRQVSGLSKEDLYFRIYDSLAYHWRKQDSLTTLTTFKRISKAYPGAYTHYKLGSYLNDSIRIAEKTGRWDVPKIVKIHDSGREEKICYPGYYTSELIFANVKMGTNSPGSFTMDNLALENGKMAWAVLEIDPRWKQMSYSVIRIRDIETGKTRRLAPRTRYFAPSFLPGAKQMIVSEVDQSSRFYLTLVDVSTGKQVSRFQTPGNDFFTYPSVSRDGRFAYSVVIGKQGKSLVRIDLQSGSVKTVIPFSYHEISRPVALGNHVFFTGDYSGIDNIYAIDTATSGISQVTSSRFGAVDARISPDGRRMIYSDYTADGYALGEIPIEPGHWIPLADIKDHSLQLWRSYENQESGLMNEKNIPDSAYRSEPYSKAGHLFHLHSWGPFSFNFQTFSLKPGISLMSQNMLSTMFMTAGYEFERRIRDGRFHVELSYRGWYPVLDFSAETGFRMIREKGQPDQRWKESGLAGGVNIPFQFIYNRFAATVTPEIKYRYLLSDRIQPEEGSPVQKKINQLEIRLQASNMIKKAELELRPRWGQQILLSFNKGLFGNSATGSLASFETTLFFPGVARFHSLMIYGGYHYNSAGSPDFREIIKYPRGYYYQQNDRLISLSADYTFPFAYPDLEFGRLVYLKRLKANLFFDAGRGTKPGIINEYRSFGIDLLGDIIPFHHFVVLEIGLRTAYLPLDKQLDFRILLSIDVNGF